MKKSVIAFTILGLVLLTSIFTSATGVTPPNPPSRPMQFIEDTGATPVSVDPAVAYDTASGEMIFNVYDTLITFNAEHLDQYIGVIADQWWSQNITGTTSPSGLPWYWRYTFHMRNTGNVTNIAFSPPFNYSLTAQDVEYSFERTMILDAVGGPEWMLDEPLLNNAGGPNAMGNMAVEADVSRVGNIIDEAVEQNGTYVWFNIAFPRAYGPFMPILCQTWSSILSKQYINNQIIGELGINDWSGNWATASTTHPSWTMTHTGWIDQFDVYKDVTGPLDVGGRHMYGSGPFKLQAYNAVSKFWTMTRNVVYWRGWPANFPTISGVSPKGYVDDIRNNFGLTWTARVADLVSGAADFAAIPRNHLDAVYKNPVPPYNPPTNYPKDGIRCTPNIPTLQVEAMFFTFSIDPATLFGPINAPGVFTSDGIPSDFFSNPVWGIHMRKAFAYALNYVTLIQTAFFGEAQHVYTALIPGLPYYDPSVKGYDYNLTAAAAELAQVSGIMQNGFTIKVVWNTGNLARQTAANLLQTAMATINATFVVTPVELDWDTMLAAAQAHQAPIFMDGWPISQTCTTSPCPSTLV